MPEIATFQTWLATFAPGDDCPICNGTGEIERYCGCCGREYGDDCRACDEGIIRSREHLRVRATDDADHRLLALQRYRAQVQRDLKRWSACTGEALDLDGVPNPTASAKETAHAPG